jgi:hypothetical protein
MIMSTRANIVITDISGAKLWFYRHSDGYPEGTLPTLNKFLDMVKCGQIRDNVGQAAGWLIVLGREEYADDKFNTWKVGAYEPTTGKHGDVEYIYTVNLSKRTIAVKEV